MKRTPPATKVDTLTVVESYPGCWSVSATGISVTADTAAEAIAKVHDALLLAGKAHRVGVTP